jgi:hypothetical protein
MTSVKCAIHPGDTLDLVGPLLVEGRDGVSGRFCHGGPLHECALFIELGDISCDVDELPAGDGIRDDMLCGSHVKDRRP